VRLVHLNPQPDADSQPQQSGQPDAAVLRQWFTAARQDTLNLFANISDTDFQCQTHPDFSPVGWHLGHIGVTEVYWISQQCEGEAPLSEEYDQFFSPIENPKTNRINLPERSEILAYLRTARDKMFTVLEQTDFPRSDRLLQDARIFRMLLQHEAQHQEIITVILQLLAARQERPFRQNELDEEVNGNGAPPVHEMVRVPAGSFTMGNNQLAVTLDNERSQHEVYVEEFQIDRYPVTNAAFLEFVQNRGYQERSYWSPEGWAWREKNGIEHPLYWRQQGHGRNAGWVSIGLQDTHALIPHHPVMCVSWYEAEAYANAIGKRLPTEAEWEKAAAWDPGLNTKRSQPWGESRESGAVRLDTERCNSDARAAGTTRVDQHPAGKSAYGCLDMQGNVWEWTGTWFHPYPDFTPYPYDGYSLPYFDQRHRVLRGGSWATRSHVMRPTFRNWYNPWVREIFAGFRCAQSSQARQPQAGYAL
jgi:iron(II)-dependent oxidoreductase